MEACHILLERSWKFDRKTTHNGHTNEITLLHKKKKFMLHPFTPSQVSGDQAQIRARREEESSKNSTLKPKSEIGESPNSIPKVISHEVLLTQKSLLNMFHEEQPSYLLYVTLPLLVFQVFHLRIYLLLLLLFFKIFKMFFQRIFLMNYLLLKELSTKLIL